MGKDFKDFEMHHANKANVVEKFMALKYGRKSVSEADDIQYRRELEIASDVSVEMLRRYHEWLNS